MSGARAWSSASGYSRPRAGGLCGRRHREMPRQQASRGDVTCRRASTILRDDVSRRLVVTSLAVMILGACSHQPPEGFAPDPGLVAQVRDIRIVTSYARACPGAAIPTSYEAVLVDGSRVPFSRTYDKKHPPRLHVVFLDRTSPEAVTQQDGDWVTDGNALATATTG